MVTMLCLRTLHPDTIPSHELPITLREEGATSESVKHTGRIATQNILAHSAKTFNCLCLIAYNLSCYCLYIPMGIYYIDIPLIYAIFYCRDGHIEDIQLINSLMLPSPLFMNGIASTSSSLVALTATSLMSIGALN